MKLLLVKNDGTVIDSIDDIAEYDLSRVPARAILADLVAGMMEHESAGPNATRGDLPMDADDEDPEA